ncbi:ribonuclease H-like domain-containing protein [Tanacetum coccineum]
MVVVVLINSLVVQSKCDMISLTNRTKSMQLPKLLYNLLSYAERLVGNMSRLDCTTKEVIKTTATISTRWKNLWTSLPHLIFSNEDDLTNLVVEETDLHGYISFIDNTLNQCPTNLKLNKFKLDIPYSSLINSEFISRTNRWIRYAISRNVEEVDLRLWDVVGALFSYDDELFFNTSCITRMTLSWCLFNPPNGAISLERLECLCISCGTLNEDMIEKILLGSPLLESLVLNYCYGFSRIDITSKSVKNLVLSGYNHMFNPYEEDYIDCVKIDVPYILSLTIEGELFLRELVLLNVSSLVEVDLKYSISYEEFVIFAEEIFRGLLESLGHVENITFGDHCSELLSRLKAGLNIDELLYKKLLVSIRFHYEYRIGVREPPYSLLVSQFKERAKSSASKISVTMYDRPRQETEVHFRDPKQYDHQVTVMVGISEVPLLTLKGTNIEVNKGQKVVICGPVDAGTC